jgi:hypothetical protein
MGLKSFSLRQAAITCLVAPPKLAAALDAQVGKPTGLPAQSSEAPVRLHHFGTSIQAKPLRRSECSYTVRSATSPTHS